MVIAVIFTLIWLLAVLLVARVVGGQDDTDRDLSVR